jgi:hypothetical protein
MPIQSIPIGPTVTLVQNVAYALPSVKTTVMCADTTPGIEISNTSDFAVKQSVTVTAGVTTVAGKFIRSTAGNITVALGRD